MACFSEFKLIRIHVSFFSVLFYFLTSPDLALNKPYANKIDPFIMTTSHVFIKHSWRSGKIENKNQTNDKELDLSDTALKMARKELREDRSARDQGLDQVRNWLKKNEDVENVRTDDCFLLRFLRAKKFSVPIAQQCMLKYLNLKRVFPQMTAQLDYLNPKLNEILTNGYLTVSPIRDQHGRRVIIIRACKCTWHFNDHSPALQLTPLTY